MVLQLVFVLKQKLILKFIHDLFNRVYYELLVQQLRSVFLFHLNADEIRRLRHNFVNKVNPTAVSYSKNNIQSYGR
jgi:hypothetical protein